MVPYPIMLNVEGRRAVVVGGGRVGRRRAEGLLAAEAKVRLVDPAPVEVPAGVQHVAEPYAASHLAGARLVFACTSDRAVNARVADDANAAAIPVNVADDPAACDFTLPAVHRTETVTVAVATSLGLPALAAALRDRFAEALPEDVDAFARALAEVRRQLRDDLPPPTRRRILVRLCGPEGWEAFRGWGESALFSLANRRAER